MRKWIIVGALAFILLGFVILFFKPSIEADMSYITPEQVQNRPDIEEQILKKFPKSQKIQKASLE